MYSKKENVGILTSLLVKHGVRHAVVCSGSRNAPIVHNLFECHEIECHPVTDERSAAFCAMGIAQADCSPVVVCVTSGTALLNVAPAIAEASYQHLPIVVVAGDLPEAWHGQLDGQYLPQSDALGRFVGCSVNIPEPRTDEERWTVGRRVNEALCVCKGTPNMPVLINVPLAEPLFDFSEEQLPPTRAINIYGGGRSAALPQEFLKAFSSAERPLIVVGQDRPGVWTAETLRTIADSVVILSEATSAVVCPCPFDEALADESKWSHLAPDFVLHMGGDLVSKRLKLFLRKCDGVEVWRISPTATIEDTFGSLCGVLVGDACETMRSISKELAESFLHDNVEARRRYKEMWQKELAKASQEAESKPVVFSSEGAIRLLHAEVEKRRKPNGQSDYVFQYANSTPIRIANTYSKDYVFCNRGVSGIDGSISTAAGFSMATNRTVLCVTGDLSFFYDGNALWNTSLRGNLRVMLLNNGRGGIFGKLPGLTASPAFDKYISAHHGATARGLCETYGAEYAAAHNMEELIQGIGLLIAHDAQRPLVLEVLLDK